MAAAHSSSHYIRTIHTSFTAAHSGPWARTNTVPLNMPLHYQPPQLSKYPQQPLLASPPASGAGGRRRAYAFRAPSAASSSGPTPPSTKGGYKFDPFADEPTTPVPSLATLASLSAPPAPRLAAASLPASQQLHQQGHYSLPPNQPRRHTRGYYTAGPPQPRTGYHQQRPRNTYQGYSEPSASSARYVPPTTEIWRAPTSSIPRGRSLTYEFEEYDYDSSSSSGGNGGLKSYSAPLPVTTIREPVVHRQRTPSPPTPAPVARAQVSAPTPNRFFNDKDAKAKLVAGILLNRVHAVGKPRRRVPSPVGAKKAYVPSSLSTVISCEA